MGVGRTARSFKRSGSGAFYRPSEFPLCAEEAQDYEKAYSYYKDVYSSDVTFGDLNERMLKIGKLLQESRK